MALIIWTAANSDSITKTFGAMLKMYRPNVPEHSFVSFDADEEGHPEPGPGDVVIACGAKPLSVLCKAGIAPKNRTVNSMREKPIQRPSGGHILVTFDPGVVSSEPHQREVIEWDLRLANRLMTTGGTVPVIGQYKWVNTYQPMIDWIEKRHAKTGKAVDVSVDLETEGFYPWYKDRNIVSISFTCEQGRSELLYTGPQDDPVPIDPSTPLHDQIKWLLTSPKVKIRAANGKFDMIWMAEKWDIVCTNFVFDTLLVGSLLNENRTNSLNLHAKIYTPLGGYDDCVTPDTRVCTADLRWVPIGEVKPGDELVGFDEQVEPGCRRRMRVAKAISTKRLIKRGVRVTFDNGTVINCSFDHGFMAHERNKGNGPYTWVRARDLMPGARVMLVVPVEEEVNTKDAGYLAGLYDGEGFVSFQKYGLTSGISQKPGGVWDRYTKLMADHGLGGFYSLQKNGDGVHTSKHTGWPTLRLLQLFRPERLIAKRPFNGKCVPSGAPQLRVVSVEWLDDIEVVSLTTTTHTFVAEGIASHNSFNATVDKGKMGELPPDEKFLTYAGGDTDACFQCADVLRDELVNDGQLTRFYMTIVQPAARAFEKMERRGVLVDREKYAVLRQDLCKVIDEGQQKALELLPNKLRIKYRDRIQDQLAEGKNPMLPSLLKDYFFTPNGLNLKPRMLTGKTQEPSMAKAHLRMFEDTPEAVAMVQVLTEVDRALKCRSTFVDGFLHHLRPDGCFHPTYMLFHGGFNDDADDESGTVSGRLAAKDPAFQTLPKKAAKGQTNWAKRLRECYIAPKGKVILQLDYSQGELKVVACIAPEKTMIASYEKGLDLHAVTGAQIAEIDFALFMEYAKKETSSAEYAIYADARDRAKPANFGLLYGMSAEGFVAYAWASYGRKFTLQEAEKIRNAFFKLYPGLLDYHERMKKMARIREEVRSPLGRIRHLPHIRAWDRSVRSKAERQAINSPVQACLTDMMIWAIALLEDAYRNEEIATFGVIHDAMYAYVDEDKIELRTRQAKEVMENLPFEKVGWSPVLHFSADAEAGLNLANMSKVQV